MSSLRVCILALGLSVLAGCPQTPNSVICPGTGILCPEDTYCGAVQPICLTTSCGNGLVDPGEDCDDGNVLEGDTCSPICRREACGNNVLDPGEVCDDGNTTAGDGCSTSCRSKEICGNSIVDQGEACDDGNASNADGCSGTPIMVNNQTSPDACKSTEVCGNGIKDIQTGEVCDDGNTMSGDGCNSDCRSGEGCGNGFVDPGEQCDDGNANNNDACLNTCKTAKCGDGVVDNSRGEQCDAGTTGTPVETAGCNIDCTTRICGDGKVNQTSGEQCDNGVGNNGDAKNCTGGCALNVCGDGKVDGQAPGIEQCDDANQNNTDGCSNACALASCGNSTVDTGEMCDDGNIDDTDACVMCHTALCGDGKTYAGVELCDDGNTANGDGCSSTCRTEGCHNGVLDPGEQCDDGNQVNTDACAGNCKVAVCGDRFIRAGVELCDDGNLINGDGCSSTCRSEGCGNGSLDPGEACDDGNMANGDGCSSMCTFEGCGDGIVNNGEACDGGGETAACNSDCTLRSCGDAKVNATAGEQCDAGKDMMGNNLNQNNRDCTAACKINVCTDGFRDTLGPNRFEACDDGNTIATDGCSNNCTLASCGNGIVDPGEQCDDNNILNTDSCVDCMDARCGDTFVETGVEECDTLAVGTKECSPFDGPTPGCRFMVCGNGIVDAPAENCDDHNVNPNDGCSTACRIEFCGDSAVQMPREACDPTPGGNTTAGSAGCNFDCTSVTCGDGKKNAPAGETCDDGNQTSGDGCSYPACKSEFCGNGVRENEEECDGAQLTTPGADCDSDCHEVFCGNSVKDVALGSHAAEQCDNGPANSATGTCTPACKVNVCGDGNQLAIIEECDVLGGVGDDKNCTASCKLNVCGDGKRNTTVGATFEACDDGNNVNDDTCTNSCTAVTCGDGIKSTGEMCDFGPMNNTMAIPTSCPYNSSCMQCPMGCGNAVVTLTGPTCGTGGLNTIGGEQCDGVDLNGKACNTLGTSYPTFGTGGTLACDAGCKFNITGCSSCGNSVVEPGETCEPPNVAATGTTTGCDASCHLLGVTTSCGNGVINAAEQCDGTNLAGLSCTSFMYGGGTLACKPAGVNECTFDFSACTAPPPPPSCNDNLTNNGETDEDCGGNTGCQQCANTKVCQNNADCESGNCVGGATKTCMPAAGPMCNNGVIESGEQCDMAMLAGFTCTSFGTTYNGGTLACSASCTFNFAGCTTPPAAPTCNDNAQNQGESAIDCGGTGNGCQRCATGLACTVPGDCASAGCTANVCD